MARTPLRIDYVHNQSQAHRSWVAVMVAFCRLFFISFFSLISYARPDSQTTLYTEFESIDWLLIANWIRKECACLCSEAGAFKFHWLHTNESDGWRLFSTGIRTTVVMWAPSGPYNTRPHLKSLFLRSSGGEIGSGVKLFSCWKLLSTPLVLFSWSFHHVIDHFRLRGIPRLTLLVILKETRTSKCPVMEYRRFRMCMLFHRSLLPRSWFIAEAIESA